MLNNPTTMQMQAMQMLNPLNNPLAFNNPMMFNPMQPNTMSNQMNFYPQMMNPNMNPMMNNQQHLMQNNVLTSSRASSTNQKILN